jgi:hypothetical protein
MFSIKRGGVHTFLSNLKLTELVAADLSRFFFATSATSAEALFGSGDICIEGGLIHI